MFAVEWPLTRASLSNAPHSSIADSPTPRNDALEELKARVPFLKRRVGERAWSSHVDVRPIRPHPFPVASKAFYKMDEMFATCAIPLPERSLHLCEAPGGFVQATSHRAGTHLREWAATSLNTKDAPTAHEHALPVETGGFLSGLPHDSDVLRDECRAEIVGRWAGRADLVTADGASHASHDDLERGHLPLFVAQVRTALPCLATGGTLVVKFFDGRETETSSGSRASR